jgi:hypothetical protein
MLNREHECKRNLRPAGQATNSGPDVNHPLAKTIAPDCMNLIGTTIGLLNWRGIVFRMSR